MVSHELNTIMIYIHPPLAIVGYFFTFLFAIMLFRQGKKSRMLDFVGLLAWSLISLGLVTGMIWAEISWGSYWSWDPKETMTLLVFLTASAYMVAYHVEKFKITKWLAVLCCVLSVITALSSFIVVGLHSFV